MKRTKVSKEKKGLKQGNHVKNYSESLFEKTYVQNETDNMNLDTPFYPRTEEHTASLKKARTGEQTRKLLLHLQRSYGNAYVQRLLRTSNIQAKLTVSSPGDIYEQEADRVAEKVTREMNIQAQRQEEDEEELLQSKFDAQRQEDEEEELVQMTPDLQRQEEDEEELLQEKFDAQRQEDEEEELVQPTSDLQRQEEEEDEIQAQLDEGTVSTVAGDIETRINNAQGGGQPLLDEVRQPMEKAFGADFSSVRMHTDSEADMLNRELSAKAFTTGQDIFFRESEYNPSSDSGKKLIAHELTHVMQQNRVNTRHQPVAHSSTKKIQRFAWKTAIKRWWKRKFGTPIPATSLTSLQEEGKSLYSIAKELGYTGEEGNDAAIKGHIVTAMGADSYEEIKEIIEEQTKSKSKYEKIEEETLGPEKSERLKNLEIPSTLEHEQLKQEPTESACKAVAAIAGQQILDVNLLKSILISQNSDRAVFQFPPATKLDPYIKHSDGPVKTQMEKIKNTQNNTYSVEKVIHKGDLLPTTEPWANLLLKALHQHITKQSILNPDSYEVYILLAGVRNIKDEPTKDINFNVLTGGIGEIGTSAQVSQFSDEELKGKKLLIGHAGHARTLVVRADGSKVYYDNQVGVEEFPANKTVNDILRDKGLQGEGTTFTIE